MTNPTLAVVRDIVRGLADQYQHRHVDDFTDALLAQCHVEPLPDTAVRLPRRAIEATLALSAHTDAELTALIAAVPYTLRHLTPGTLTYTDNGTSIVIDRDPAITPERHRAAVDAWTLRYHARTTVPTTTGDPA
ncbi:hypothetical protein [Nocardia wallacei]|uniref:hypothetical protein n=1 Tax=Nocardia wallacei TaxID=480035 RepID=UPI0024547113|nr:hypothetical protein [Nocardia wallacei]